MPQGAIQGDTIYLPIDKVARIIVVGRDASEVERAIEERRYESSNTGIFTTSYTRGTDYVILRPVSPGTATLNIRADADTAEPDVPLTDTLTIVVFCVATQLVLFYTESGAEELLVPFDDGSFHVPLPINQTATIRVEGRDAKGNVVPLESIFAIAGALGKFHVTATSDPYVWTLIPDAIGNDSLNVLADGDPSPGSSSLTWLAEVEVLQTQADHLTETVAIESP